MVVEMPISTTHSETEMSKTAALANVVELRPMTILTTKRTRPTANKRAYLTEDEVERLIKAAPTPRDRAMILVGYTMGCASASW
jgi:integrase